MSLPLKAKVSIRDNWTNSDSPAQKSIAKLKVVLGLEIHCEPQWPILVSELENVWDDKSQLVASAVSETERPCTKWSDAKLGFVLYIPKAVVYQPVQFSELFKEQLLEVFEEKQSSKPTTVFSTTGDEWADVANEREEQSITLPSATVDYLPDASTMPKPGSLLQNAPYHLFVYASGKNKIEIECSHSQTLEVLAEYLRKWTRINPNLTNKPPAVEIGLNHANCGFGLESDRLTLFCESRYGSGFTVSATMILNLVEGVFGYERVYGDSSSWHYRRDTPFKKR
ncbi:cytochrome family 51 (sterol 14-demethylase) [Fusarium heterosporum]|uniref:Cytochrome family 51 (Sterol 14-demethylase) n=1 Tax=Fusarium heterosporum TaxID=42747 RepID=A0A8H5WB52_FUSHE|nr:cytochrome family 51 (sterol 14-demethylase) [Fusarium heterosporum]